jgi:LEA14-like dessication related protein
MKKTILAIILALLFIINIVAAAFIFIDIQIMSFPQTTIGIDVIEINSDEVIIHYDIQLYNPNSFELILQNLQIVATTTTAEEVTNITINGGSIPGQSNRSFTANERIVMKGNLSELLTSKMTGIVGVNILGVIKKTVPLEITVLTSLEEALKNISLPTLTVRTEFENITRNAVTLTAEIDITNPNPFDFFINNFMVNITTETGMNVGNFFIPGSHISGETSVTLHGTGTVVIEALNAKKLLMTLQAEAGVNIAGVSKSLPFSSEIEITIPDLNELIPVGKPLELELKPDLLLGPGGIKSDMTLEVRNPTKIPFNATNLVVKYYGVKNNQKYYISEGSFGSGEFTPEATTYFQGETLLLYSKLLNLTGKIILPDWIFAQLCANVSLSRTNLSISVAIGSYIDLKPLAPTQ